MTTVSRVASIDCGTNSVRLLIADHDPASGALTDVERHLRIVRLGQGVDATGRLAPEAMERTFAALRDYADLLGEHGVDAGSVRFCATSASRDAENADDFVAGVQGILGVTPEVVPGEEEAALSFRGATAGLPDAPGPFLVVDIGGGSSEFVYGDTSMEHALSVDMGSVRMTERHMVADPPTPEQIEAATRDIDAGLERAFAEVPAEKTHTLIGVAGSVTTITAHALRLTEFDESRVHGATFTVDETVAACAELTAASRQEKRDMPYIHPGRVDVIGAGALIWSRVVRRVADVSDVRSVLVSTHDILDGIALGVAERGR